MSTPTVIGLHGVAGAGKDTVFERLRELGGDAFVRSSVADPLKLSVAALFGITEEELEQLKRDIEARVQIVTEQGLPAELTVREFLQRYGTEAHRDVFGQDFWLDFWLDSVQSQLRLARSLGVPRTVVNTSVRFENEAAEILDLGGEVWTIRGPQDEGAAGHASEAPLPEHLVTRTIDNSERGDDFASIDRQIRHVLLEWNR